MSPSLRYLPEWEWGWKTPLLLDLPAEHAPFLREIIGPETLATIPLADAEAFLTERLDRLKTSRLGIRFERVQEALFHFHPRTLELRANVQIPERTEVDLLQKIAPAPGEPTTNRFIHWEVAVKFYLALDEGGSPDPDRWVGPSLKDCLGLKMRRIRDRQLPILAEPGARAILGLAASDLVIAAPKVHGTLHLPWRTGRDRDPFPADSLNPPGIAENRLPASWVVTSDLSDYFAAALEARPETRFRVLSDRMRWIQDPSLVIETTPENGFYPRKELPALARRLATEIETTRAPLQLSFFAPDFRVFVMPDDWPARAEGALESLRVEDKIKRGKLKL